MMVMVWLNSDKGHDEVCLLRLHRVGWGRSLYIAEMSLSSSWQCVFLWQTEWHPSDNIWWYSRANSATGFHFEQKSSRLWRIRSKAINRHPFDHCEVSETVEKFATRFFGVVWSKHLVRFTLNSKSKADRYTYIVQYCGHIFNAPRGLCLSFMYDMHWLPNHSPTK